MDQHDDGPDFVSPEKHHALDARRGSLKKRGKLHHLFRTEQGKAEVNHSKSAKRLKPSLPKLPWNDA